MYAVLTLYGRQFVAQETQRGTIRECTLCLNQKDKFYLVQEDILPEAIKRRLKVKRFLN